MSTRVQQPELSHVPTLTAQSTKVPEDLYNTILRTKECVGTIMPIKLKAKFDENPTVEVKHSPLSSSANEKNNDQPLIEFGNEISTEWSAMTGRTVSHFDIFILFLEIMKLYVENMFQERKIRHEEREEWRAFMEKVSENYKEQGRWLLMTSIGSGMLSILSGAMPLIKVGAGDWIFNKLSTRITSLAALGKDDFFKSSQKLTHAFSQMYESTGRIHNTFAESRKTKFQFLGDSAKLSVDESTRTMDEILQAWRQMESTLAEWLRMTYEDAKSLNH